MQRQIMQSINEARTEKRTTQKRSALRLKLTVSALAPMALVSMLSACSTYVQDQVQGNPQNNAQNKVQHAASATSGAVHSSEQQALQQLMDDYWQSLLANDPVFASTLKDHRFDGKLGNQNVASIKAEEAAAQALLKRLDKIDTQKLSAQQQVNAEFLRLKLQNTVDGAKFDGRFTGLTNRWGWHSGFASLPDSSPFFSKADYQSYVQRLRDFPRYNAQGISRLRHALAQGYALPCKAMVGFETSISTHIVKDVADSVFMRPFANQPNTLTDADFSSLKVAAQQAIRQHVIPAYQAFYDFYTQSYAPKCYAGDGIYGLPDAAAYYDFLVRKNTTTQMSAEEVHRLGLSEVARIRERMQALIDETGFDGTRKEFVEMLRTDPKFYPKTAEEHMLHAAMISKKADGELPKLFATLPRTPYTVKEIPADIAEKTTTAYYEPPAGDGSRAGVYRVNTSKLDTRPKFEMEALTLHEAVPGHHLQIALAYEQQDLPMFRRYYGSVTAFVEGWALYAESLGKDMGFYQTPYTQYGQLSYEMWRACRLVVDTGLHAKGWTREQAIAFMADNTALSLHNIESEVDRYMTWPGQALGYKIGELKIQQLKQKAQQALGERFDIRTFHNAVLAQGSVPLTVLENTIDQWIDEQQ